MKKHLIPLCFLSMAFCLSADDIETHMNKVKQLDKNKDEKIDKSEAQGPIKKKFDKIDQNKDGFLDFKEIKKALEMMLNKK